MIRLKMCFPIRK